MTGPEELRAVLAAARAAGGVDGAPFAGRLLLVPEIEAIATAVLQELEDDGVHVVPTARAARLTMDREGIRRLAAEELGLPTSPYRFCRSQDELRDAYAALSDGGTVPCVVKPVMSSSGKGQSVIRAEGDVATSWRYAQEAGRTGASDVICEGFVAFDYEITLLSGPRRSHARSPTGSEATACSASSCSSAVTRCSSARSRPGRTTPGW